MPPNVSKLCHCQSPPLCCPAILRSPSASLTRMVPVGVRGRGVPDFATIGLAESTLFVAVDAVEVLAKGVRTSDKTADVGIALVCAAGCVGGSSITELVLLAMGEAMAVGESSDGSDVDDGCGVADGAAVGEGRRVGLGVSKSQVGFGTGGALLMGAPQTQRSESPL